VNQKRQELGKKGEDLADDYLKRKGYSIVHRNFRMGRAEIDLIATFQNVLIFIEVKTRSSTQFGFPEEFVTSHKEQMLFQAADEYCETMNVDLPIRFDIVAIVINNSTSKITHFEDAFWPSP